MSDIWVLDQVASGHKALTPKERNSFWLSGDSDRAELLRVLGEYEATVQALEAAKSSHGDVPVAHPRAEPPEIPHD